MVRRFGVCALLAAPSALGLASPPTTFPAFGRNCARRLPRTGKNPICPPPPPESDLTDAAGIYPQKTRARTSTRSHTTSYDTANFRSRMTTEMIQVDALSVRFLVEAADSNGSVSVFECFVPADSKMPAPHSHDSFEETIYGLAGATSWSVDGRALDIRPGEAFCIPRGAVHGFDNHGTDEARFLAIPAQG